MRNWYLGGDAGKKVKCVASEVRILNRAKNVQCLQIKLTKKVSNLATMAS